jgi:hypothetical protein
MLKQQSKVRRKVLNPSWRKTSSVDFVAISAKMIPHLRSAKHMTTTAKETRAKQASRRWKASRIARLSGKKPPSNATKLHSGRRNLKPHASCRYCRASRCAPDLWCPAGLAWRRRINYRSADPELCRIWQYTWVPAGSCRRAANAGGEDLGRM